MPEYFEHIRIEGVILGLSEQTGAIVVYTKSNLRGENLEASTGGMTNRKTYGANVVERTINNRQTFAAIFPRLPVGTYNIYHEKRGDIKRSQHGLSVFAGEVTEVDWR